MSQIQSGFADNNGVKIHYVSIGKGPLVVMIHGFPDFWYSWRYQIPALMDAYQVVAIDQRGYNESDKPQGVEAYKVEHLVEDVAAVIKKVGTEKATIVGHDWGGFVAWNFAARHPEMTGKLVVCNLPHPKNLARELAHNPEQQKNSQYAQTFKQPGVERVLRPETFVIAVAKDDEARAKYKAAFEKSDMAAMLNYYKANYPNPPYSEAIPDFPVINAPVLIFHGLKDKALHHHGLNGTWEYLGKDCTIVTAPEADHWVHHEAIQLVNGTLRDWLDRRK